MAISTKRTEGRRIPLIEFNRNRFFVAFGAKYLERHLNDDKFWAELLTKKLNPKLKLVEPLLLVQSFQDNYDFKKLMIAEDLQTIKNMTEGNEDLLQKLKEKAHMQIGNFEWSWIEEWWKKDHPGLLAVVKNHPKSKEFMIYLTNGIEGLAKTITDSF